jgi:hypothetical protein
LAALEKGLRAGRLDFNPAQKKYLHDIFTEAATTGALPTGFLYLGHDLWSEIYDEKDPTTEIFQITLSTLKLSIVRDLRAANGIDAVFIGVGTGQEVDLFLREFSGFAPNLTLIDQSQGNLPASQEAIASSGLEHGNIDYLQFDFRNATDLVPVTDKPRFVVFKGRTTGNIPNTEVVNLLNSQSRVGDYVYFDVTNLNFTSDSSLSDILSYYNTETGKSLAVRNLAVVLSELNSAPLDLHSFVRRVKVGVECRYDPDFQYEVKFSVKLSSNEIALIKQYFGVELPESLILSRSVYGKLESLRSLILENGYFVLEVKSPLNWGVSGFLVYRKA